MLRLCALTLVVATLAGVGALVQPNEAQALSNPQSTLLRALSPADLKALIADIDAQGLQSGGSTNVRTGTTRMQIAAGRIAPLTAVSTIGAVATGSILVWQIADALGLGGYVYKRITGHSYSGATTGVVNPRWNYFAAGASGICTGAYNSGTGCWNFRHDTSTATYCNPANAAGCNKGLEWSTWAGGLSGMATGNINGSCGIAGGNTNCMVKTRTAVEMQRQVTIGPSTAAEYASPPAGSTTVSGGTNDTTTPTDPELAAALDEIDPNPGATGTAVEQETAEAILDELDPGWEVGTAITLLQPMPNETYTDYIARLQASGYVGTATATVLTSEVEGIGPLAVARLTFTQGSTTRTLSPIAWPTTAPTIQPNAALTVRYNPSTAAPAPTEGGTGISVTVTLPETTIPAAPGIDFSPITDLDGACSFPFGFICYAQDVTAAFDVTADAPVFDLDVTVPDLAGGGTIDYAVDLNVMDAYTAMLRGLISFVLWIGAVYFLAVNLLGFRAGGDPSEAADEALHV